MNILALIAHPDDLEIAAAGTISRLVSEDHKVLIGVVTDESDCEIRTIRQSEALNAAATIGVPASQVLFLGQEDRYASNDVNACRQLQSWLKLRQFSPDVVITHSDKDTHQDHRAVRKLALSATHYSAGLYLYAAVVNSLKKPEFQPSVFVETSQQWETKKAALACYPSQDKLGRIRIQDINQHELTYAQLLGAQRVEAFEANYSDAVMARRLLQKFAIPYLTDNVIAEPNNSPKMGHVLENQWWRIYASSAVETSPLIEQRPG